VIVHEPDPGNRAELAYFKLGEGPFYVFYTPFHLPQIQVASSIARAAVLGAATAAPLDGPVCEVLTVAKRDLDAGEVLDGVGGFCAYGLIENAGTARIQDALPMGLSEGSRLLHPIRRDQMIRFADVERPSGRLAGSGRTGRQVAAATRDPLRRPIGRPPPALPRRPRR
jgi:predicted homoserine dehydrogenase-like protein